MTLFEHILLTESWFLKATIDLFATQQNQEGFFENDDNIWFHNKETLYLFLRLFNKKNFSKIAIFCLRPLWVCSALKKRNLNLKLQTVYIF